MLGYNPVVLDADQENAVQLIVKTIEHDRERGSEGRLLRRDCICLAHANIRRNSIANILERDFGWDATLFVTRIEESAISAQMFFRVAADVLVALSVDPDNPGRGYGHAFGYDAISDVFSVDERKNGCLVRHRISGELLRLIPRDIDAQSLAAKLVFEVNAWRGNGLYGAWIGGLTACQDAWI
jgi:hypothetical protein